MKVALVGCGNIARVHLPYVLVNERVTQVALCDHDELRLRFVLDEGDYPQLTRYGSLERMLSEYGPNLVHVLTPPASHASVATQALRGGAHVLIEKPMCASVAEAEAIVETARANARKVCVDHTRLYDPMVMRARHALASGELGEIVRVQSVSFDDYLERQARGEAADWARHMPGGPLLDFLPHSLYLLDHFLPGLVLRDAQAMNWENGIPRHLFASFTAPTGAADLHISLAMCPLQYCLQIWCTRGTVFIDFRNFSVRIQPHRPLSSGLSRVYDNLRTSTQIVRDTVAGGLKLLTGDLDSYAGLREIIARFYEAIEGDAPAPVSAEKALPVVQLAEQILANLEPTRRGAAIAAPGSSTRKSAENTPGPRVLVTGGTGFVGRHLVERLVRDGERVRVLCRKTSDLSELPKDGVEVVYGDIRDCPSLDEALKGIELVYHLAAAMRGNWTTHLDVTVGGTRNVLEVARQRGVAKVVYVSSLSVLDASRYPDGEVIDETFPYEQRPRLRGYYSRAKLEAEKLVCQFADDESSPAIVILRPGLVHGPGGPGYVADAGHFIKRRLFLVAGMGRRLLPLVYVENLVDALILAGRGDQVDGKVYNVVDASTPRQREYLAKYASLTGIKVPILFVPLWLIRVGLGILQRGISLLPGRSAPALTYRLRCTSRSVLHSTARIQADLGWHSRVSFDEGLRRTLAASPGAGPG